MPADLPYQTDARLVTLTGIGGSGKTRLAMRVAAQVRRAFRDRVWFVDLTELHEPAQVVQQVRDVETLAYLIAATLGVRGHESEPLRLLVEQLAGRPTLLVVDNCEHLIPACAAVVDRLLRGCPDLRVLATSRESLAISGEILVQIPPLPVPEPRRSSLADLARCESVALFVERGRLVLHGFDLTAGHLATVRGDLDVATDLLRAAHDMARDCGDALTLARATKRLGAVAMHRGDLHRAETLLADALERLRALDGAEISAVHAQIALMLTRFLQGDLTASRTQVAAWIQRTRDECQCLSRHFKIELGLLMNSHQDAEKPAVEKIARALLSTFPDFDYVHFNNVDAHGQFAPSMFFWEVVQVTVRSYLGDRDEPDWRSTLDFMEAVVRSGGLDERTAVAYHFLWNLPNRGEPGHDLVGELGPELTRVLTRLQHRQPLD